MTREVEKAKRELRYQPEHNFSEFYTALKEGDEGYYPFAGLPWWALRTLSED